ncbi:MAG: hypothetical protein ABR600_02560 [Actinomycetota bacterium]
MISSISRNQDGSLRILFNGSMPDGKLWAGEVTDFYQGYPFGGVPCNFTVQIRGPY